MKKKIFTNTSFLLTGISLDSYLPPLGRGTIFNPSTPSYSEIYRQLVDAKKINHIVAEKAEESLAISEKLNYLLQSNKALSEKRIKLQSTYEDNGKILNLISKKILENPENFQAKTLNSEANSELITQIEQLKKNLENTKADSDFVESMLNSQENSIINNSAQPSDSTSNIESNSTIKTSDKNLIENLNTDEPLQGNVLGPIEDLINNFREYLSTLTTEELGNLTNALGFSLVFVLFTSIVSIQFGNYLISSLKLEERYPRLAKYIKYRKNMANYSLAFYYVAIYFVLVIFIIVNLLVLLCHK